MNLKATIGNRHPIRLGWHYLKAYLSAARFDFPAKDMLLMGVTGTDGKTTTVGMVAHILHASDIPCGALSTAFFKINDDIQWNETQKTSPSPWVIQKFLQKLKRAGCTHAILEYSSHGLVQGRTFFTWPSVVGITNVSAEHLDYHGTMEQYRKDKSKLFQMLNGGGVKVINAADESAELLQKIPSGITISYALDRKDIGADDALWVTDMQDTPDGVSAVLHHAADDKTWQLSLPIPGRYNLENALCAISMAMGVSIPIGDAVKALETFHTVPGRFERIDEGQPFSVYVDFTVTPAAYRKTLATLRHMIGSDKRILVLTGSCGDRMREKRPHVGQVCSELADVVVVTNEDPYTEDPEKIIDEVWAGVDQSVCEAHRISDRREAMKLLLNKAQPGDAVIFCAKGSDTTMWTAEGQTPWNEREITRELLRSMQ